MATAVLTLQYEMAQSHRISSYPSEAEIKKRKQVHAAAVWYVFGFIFLRQRHLIFVKLDTFNQNFHDLHVF